MDRPDTIVEIHRERVETMAGGVYQGDTYTRPYEGAYTERGTATLSITLGRVWFTRDRHARSWQELEGTTARDPARHFAIDLQISNARIIIDSLAGAPLLPLPPVTITIPDGPRAGEQRQFAYNEVPLFGTLTLHEQLKVRQVAPGKQTLCLDFNTENAPVLLAAAASDTFASRLFGPGIERRPNGSTTFSGVDPRIVWDMDYAEAYWITHSPLGQLLVSKEALLHPLESDAQHRLAVLDSIAAQLAVAVREVASGLGTAGIVDLLPSPLDVDANSEEGIRALDGVVQQFTDTGAVHETLIVQLQTMDALPDGEELPASALATNPVERVALATAGFGILRGVRTTVKRSFCLSDSDFVASAGCELAGAKDVNIGGETRRLRRLKATIVEGSDDDRGKLVVEGKISDDTTYYEFDATFKITYELDLDDIPREADVAGAERGTSTGETKAALDLNLREKAVLKCSGDLDVTEYEKEAQRVAELFKELPRTVGVRPTLNPAEPEVDPNFSLTWEGYALAALGIAALIAVLAAPGAAIAGAAAVGAEGAIALLIAAIVAYVALVIDIDWYGTGMVRGKIEDALGDRPGGTLLPTLGVPIDVQLRRHLTVFYRPLPNRLGVTCVKHDTREDVDNVIQLVGGTWPTDGKVWKISDNDAVLLIDRNELELFVDLGNGAEQPIHVSTSSLNRRYLRTDPDAQGVDNLASLPECPRTP